MKKRKRLAITLIEMVIVMVLIAIVTGALAVNYRGILEKGKAFKTEQNIRKLEAILTAHFMENGTDNWTGDKNQIEQIVKTSPLGGENAQDLMRDGWGKQLTIGNPPEDTAEWRIPITSSSLDAYKGRTGTKRETKN